MNRYVSNGSSVEVSIPCSGCEVCVSSANFLFNSLASEHNSLGPAINRLNFPETSAEPLSLTRSELETLSAPLFDDYLGQRAPDVSTNSAA